MQFFLAHLISSSINNEINYTNNWNSYHQNLQCLIRQCQFRQSSHPTGPGWVGRQGRPEFPSDWKWGCSRDLMPDKAWDKMRSSEENALCIYATDGRLRKRGKHYCQVPNTLPMLSLSSQWPLNFTLRSPTPVVIHLITHNGTSPISLPLFLSRGLM